MINDHLGRLRKVNYGVVNGTPAFSVSYTFDANGNRTGMTDQAGSSRSYDKNNHLLSEARTQNGVPQTASYSYTQGGQLVSMTTLNSQMVSYSAAPACAAGDQDLRRSASVDKVGPGTAWLMLFSRKPACMPHMPLRSRRPGARGCRRP